MVIWPFKKRQFEELSTEQLRTQLISAAASSKRELRALCKHYKNQIVSNVDFMCKVPDGMDTNSDSVNHHVQCLGAIAHCLANDFNAPELWDTLCGTPDDNPLQQWNHWFEEIPQRMDNLEYDLLITEAQSFIEPAKALQGTAARQNEALIHGKLGDLLFKSGKVADAIAPFQIALKICQEIDDVEGQLAYLNNLLEVYRYLGKIELAITNGEELLPLYEKYGLDTSRLAKQVEQLRKGEPLCRIVCVCDSTEMELDEIKKMSDGRYEFQFRRNRLSLQKATILVEQGNSLASNGQYADALEKYQEASEVDPYNPDPLYQSGTCLLELGAYSKAVECYEEVERLAPGWFRCRSDIWLARSLENGTVTDEEFHLLRALEDGGLDSKEAMKVAEKAIETFPEFAPFYLLLGDLQRNKGETESAISLYQSGLKLVTEPDLESRLLCALAAVLTKEEPERMNLIERVGHLEGSLMAQATAKLLSFL